MNTIRDERKKHAEFWECIGSRLDSTSGKIYDFRPKEDLSIPDSLSDPEKQNREQALALKTKMNFPAFEPYEKALRELFSTLTESHELGYGLRKEPTRTVLSLPDREALIARFDHVRKNRPELPALRIKDSEGIAPDMEFSEAFISGYHILLSSGKEFVHDHFSHSLLILFLMIHHTQDYFSERERLQPIIKEVYDRIVKVEKAMKKGIAVLSKTELEKVKTTLGVIVDEIWNAASIDDLRRFKPEDINSFPYSRTQIWQNPDYGQYWARKFNGERVDWHEVCQLWHKVMTFCERSSTL